MLLQQYMLVVRNVMRLTVSISTDITYCNILDSLYVMQILFLFQQSQSKTDILL